MTFNQAFQLPKTSRWHTLSRAIQSFITTFKPPPHPPKLICKHPIHHNTFSIPESSTFMPYLISHLIWFWLEHWTLFGHLPLTFSFDPQEASLFIFADILCRITSLSDQFRFKHPHFTNGQNNYCHHLYHQNYCKV